MTKILEIGCDFRSKSLKLTTFELAKLELELNIGDFPKCGMGYDFELRWNLRNFTHLDPVAWSLSA